MEANDANHREEEMQLMRTQEADLAIFLQKQEKELQGFRRRQRKDSDSLRSLQDEEKHYLEAGVYIFLFVGENMVFWIKWGGEYDKSNKKRNKEKRYDQEPK